MDAQVSAKPGSNFPEQPAPSLLNRRKSGFPSGRVAPPGNQATQKHCTAPAAG